MQSRERRPYVDVQVEPQVIPTNPYNPDGMRPRTKQGKAIGHLILKPIIWMSNSAKWLTLPTKQGGAKYVMWAMAIGCLGLSIENSYCLFTDADHKFLPKPGINDGANISRILPLGDVGNAAIGGMTDISNLLGAKLHRYQPFSKTDFLVWTDPRFYGGLVLCLMVNGIQAMALRRVSLQIRAKQLQKASVVDDQINNMTQNFEARAVDYQRLETRVRQAQVKHYGSGNVLTMGAIVAASYVYEFATFAVNSAPGAPFIGTVLLGLASVFGAEVLWATGDHMDQREEE